MTTDGESDLAMAAAVPGDTKLTPEAKNCDGDIAPPIVVAVAAAVDPPAALAVVSDDDASKTEAAVDEEEVVEGKTDGTPAGDCTW